MRSALAVVDLRVTSPLPRALGRFGRVAPMPGDDARTVAVDDVTEREVEIVRVPFGRDRRAERDAAVRRFRERTTVVHPAIRAVVDGGEWDDDAFVALDVLRGETPLAGWLASADGPARARAAAEILAGAAVLAARRLSFAVDPEILVEDSGQPKILGVERALEGDDARVAATEAELVELAATAAPTGWSARIRSATSAALRESMGAELEREGRGGPVSPFTADVARSDAALARGASSRQMLIGLGVIAFFVVLVTAGLVLLR